MDGTPPVARREHVILAIGLLCGVYYVLDALTNQQTDLIVAALVILGCRALVDGRNWSAGLAFGLAAGIKCTPLLWLCYLLWRRRWGAALMVPVVAVGINLIPDLTYPSSASRFQEWESRFLLPMTHQQHDMGSWVSSVRSNHSLTGLYYRTMTWDASGDQIPSSDRFSPQTLRAVGFASMSLFVVAALVCTWKRAIPQPDEPEPMSLEFGLVLILMVLLSPASSKPHFCTLLLPGFCLARVAIRRPNRLLWVLLLAAITCGLVSNKDLVGRRVYDWVLWHGSVTLNAIFLFAGCCLALLSRPRSVAVLADPAPQEMQTSRRAA